MSTKYEVKYNTYHDTNVNNAIENSRLRPCIQSVRPWRMRLNYDGNVLFPYAALREDTTSSIKPEVRCIVVREGPSRSYR